MPMKLSGRAQLWTPLVFGALLAIALLSPLPHGSRATGAIGDAMHGLLFAVFGFLVCRALLKRWPHKPLPVALITCMALFLLGAAAEVAQQFVGRGPSLQDALVNALGALAGGLWALAAATLPRRRRAVLRAAALAVLVVAVTHATMSFTDALIQIREFPLIGSFERPLEALRWNKIHAQVRRVSQHATDGDWSLRVDMRPSNRPGTCIGSTPCDWSAYDELLLDVYLDGDAPLDWVVLIEDQFFSPAKGRRYRRHLRLLPGQQHVVIPLADVARGAGEGPVNLRDIGLLLFTAKDPKQPCTVFLDNIRLR